VATLQTNVLYVSNNIALRVQYTYIYYFTISILFPIAMQLLLQYFK